MLKKPHLMALGLIGLLTLVVLNLPQRTANQLKLAVGSVFLPLFGLSKSSQQLTQQAGDTMTSRAELIAQNAELRKTNQALEYRVAQAERDNEQLRILLNLRRQLPWKQLKAARVVGREPAPWWKTIQIDVGSRDGPEIRENLPVLSREGYLVGRIVSIGLTQSQVALIGDPNCKVSAAIEKSNEGGIIVSGVGPLDHTIVNLSFLSSAARLKPGQRVLTSDRSLIFPRGIPIGQIADEPRLAEMGSAVARVKLAADLGALEDVWVLILP